MDEPFCCACLRDLEASCSVNLSVINDDLGLTYADCIKICTNIEFNERHNLCEPCILELKTSYAFFKKVTRSQRVLTGFKNKSNLDNEASDTCNSVCIKTVQRLADSLDEATKKDHKLIETAFKKFRKTQKNKEQEVDTEEEEADTLSMELFEQAEQEETVEVEALGFDYHFEENATLEESTDIEEVKVSNMESTVLEVTEAEVSEIDEEKSVNITLEIAESTKNGELAISSIDEVSFHQIEIIPVQCVTVGNTDSTNSIQQSTQKTNPKTSSERPRKRFFGKFCCDYCDKLFPNHSRMLVHRRSHEPDRPKYPCHECGRIYATNQALEVHIRAVHKISGYPCKLCSKVFPVKGSLTVHMRFHTGNFPYVCETCGHKFAQLCHLNTHRNVKHNCVRFCCSHPNCGKFFTSTASLRNHEYSHGLMPFECEFCHRGYPSKSKLKVHIRRAHKKDLTLEELEPMRRFHVMRSKPNVMQVAMPSLKKNSSTEYKQITKRKSAYKRIKDQPKTSVNSQFKRRQKNKPIQPANNIIKPLTKTTSQNQTALKSKKRILTKVRATKAIGPPYICEQCGHDCPTRALLISHRHRKHTLKAHQIHCEKCKKPFDTHQQLARHLKRPTCEAYPKITCEYCKKILIGQANYKVHLRFHTKEYPFICHLCAKAFMLAEHLNNHIKTKHENQRFVCEHPNCGKQFQTRHSLKTHMYTHLSKMPFSCSHCGRMMPNKGRLRWHITRTHKLVVSLSDLDEMRVSDEMISIKAQLKATNC